MTRTLLGLALSAALLASLPAAARGETLHRSGPAEDRLDLVILADGYLASEQAQFAAEARRVFETLRRTEPFASYMGLMNVHTGFRASARSGVGEGTAYSTRFRTTFGTTVYSDNQRLILSDAVRAAGEADAVLVILPSNRHAGTALGKVCYVTTGAGPAVAMHELGHVIGGLGDEYTSWSGSPSLSPEATAARYPNLTLANTRETLPWKDWVEPSTRVPASFFGSDKVGAYLGGGAYSSRVYRPERTCRMRSDWSGFCVVCRQHLVLAFHEDSTPLKREVATISGQRRLRIVSALPSARWQIRWSGVQAQGLEAFVPAGASATVRLEDTTAWVRGTLRAGLRYSFQLDGGARPTPAGVTVRWGRLVDVTTRLRVRSGPNTSSAILGYLTPDASVAVIGAESGGFYPIDFEGNQGYVSSSYVDLDVPNSVGLVGRLGGAQ